MEDITLRKAHGRHVQRPITGPRWTEGNGEAPTGTCHPAQAEDHGRGTHGSTRGGEPYGHSPTLLSGSGNPGARPNRADLTRRDFLRLTGLVAVSAVVAACRALGAATPAPAGTAVIALPSEVTNLLVSETTTALAAEDQPTEHRDQIERAELQAAGSTC